MEPQYSFLENNRFSRESSCDEKQLRKLFYQGRIDRETKLWLWDGDRSRLAGTYESLFILNRRFKERRLGIYGQKNAGKTAFLACCQQRGTNRSNIEPTTKISTVDFSLLNGGTAWEVRTLDYPGEQIEKKIDDWFAESDAVLVLIESADISVQIDKIRFFLDALRRRSPDGNRIDKPIAVVWTKSDLYENPECPQELRELVETFGKREAVGFFSVSIFDPDNINEPILWSVRKIDELQFESVAHSGLTSKRKILNEYRKLRDVWGINREELGKKITELEKELRQKNLTVNIIGTIIIFVILLFWMRNSYSKRDLLEYVTVKDQIKHAEKQKEVETILKNYNKFWKSQKHVADIEELAQEKKQEIAVRETNRMFHAAKYAVQNAETPEKIDKAFEKFRNEAVGHTPEQLDELTVLAAQKRQDIQFRVAADWERESYEKFYRQAVKARTAEDLKNADESAKQYLLDAEKRTALQFPNNRKAEVETWKAWFDGLKHEHPLELTVKTIDVPKSFFKGKNLEGKITVLLQLGKSKADFSIPQLDEEQKNSDPVRLNIDLTCSIDNAVWDEDKKTNISLMVAEYLDGWRYFGQPAAKAVCKVSGSEYPYIEFCPMPDGVFVFISGQAAITVTTDPKRLGIPVQ